MITTELIEKCELNLSSKYKYFEDVALYNQEKVLKAFQNYRLALRHFVGTTGYGYGRQSYGTGNLCCDLWCLDTMCECMGGDLCACM